MLKINWTVAKVWGKFRELSRTPHPLHAWRRARGLWRLIIYLWQDTTNNWTHRKYWTLELLHFYVILIIFAIPLFNFILLWEGSQHNNKQNNRQPWLKITIPLSSECATATENSHTPGLKDSSPLKNRVALTSGLNKPKNIPHEHPSVCVFNKWDYFKLKSLSP